MENLINFDQMTIIDPEQRIKELAKIGNMVVVDQNIALSKYYRSGQEMVRMASVYLKEGSVENAYILYFKFMTLFIEKVKVHPEYKTLPATIKQPINSQLKEVMPVCEKLKQNLLARYKKEYEQFLIEKEKERKRLVEEAKEKDRKNALNKTNHHVVMPSAMPTAPDLSALDQVVYPNDFPSDPQRSNLPPGGLILPGDATIRKPTVDRKLKPTSLLEGGLRTVVVPEDTMEKFLKLAQSNTSNNVETCGILAGQLKQNQLNITHVILPKQSGTADSCTTMSEEDLFEVQDQHNLITLGWIHTHPSQTAFLSSVDLHTHCSYQIMMPEALAIVCAPKYKETGFFILTPIGLDYIAKCRQSGFHPHPNDPALFMESQHILIDNQVKCNVVDLRR